MIEKCNDGCEEEIKLKRIYVEQVNVAKIEIKGIEANRLAKKDICRTSECNKLT